MHRPPKIVDFERNASTLRTNSRPLALCGRLVTRNAVNFFEALQDFHPSPMPHFSTFSDVAEQLWIERVRRQERELPLWVRSQMILKRVREERVLSIQDREDWDRKMAEGLESLDEWWKDTDKWVQRRVQRVLAFEEFRRTCVTLFDELGEIDGSASAHEMFGKIRGGSISLRRPRQDFADYFADMEKAMEDVDERRFMELCDSALNCIKGKLRSDAVRQGVSCDIFIFAYAQDTRARNARKEAGSLSKFIHGLRDRRHFLLEHYRNYVAILIHGCEH